MARLVSCPCGRKVVVSSPASRCAGCGRPVGEAGEAAAGRTLPVPAAPTGTDWSVSRRTLLRWLPVLLLGGILVVPLVLLARSVKSALAEPSRSVRWRRLRTSLGSAALFAAVVGVFVWPYVSRLLDGPGAAARVVRIPPGVYPLQTEHDTPEGVAASPQGSVPAFVLDRGRNRSLSPESLTECVGPLRVRRLLGGHVVDTLPLKEALGTWVRLRASWRDHHVAIEHVDGETGVGYELEVEADGVALLGADAGELRKVAARLDGEPALRDAVRAADAHGAKLREVFGDESGVLRAFHKVRQEKLESAWLSSAWDAAKAEDRIGEFRRSVTHADPNESLALLSIVHGDALDEKQIALVRDVLGYTIAPSYDALDDAVAVAPRISFDTALVMREVPGRRDGIVADAVGWRTGYSDLRPADGLSPIRAAPPRPLVWPPAPDGEAGRPGHQHVRSAAANRPNFAAIVKTLQWAYQSLTGPTVTLISHTKSAAGEHWRWLIEWSSSGALWLAAVLQNWREADPATPPCQRLREAIEKANKKFGSGGAAPGTPKGLTGRTDLSYDNTHLQKHLPDTPEAAKLIKQEGAAHLFKDEATLRRVEAEILARGESTGAVRGAERYGLRFDEPIGYRIDAAGNKIPLHYGELKLDPATGKYHVIPRTGPSK